MISVQISAVLLDILEKNGKMSGYDILQKTKENYFLIDNQEINSQNLYISLHDLESENLITSQNIIKNGRVKKYYFITEKGTKQNIINIAEILILFQNIQKLSLKIQ